MEVRSGEDLLTGRAYSMAGGGPTLVHYAPSDYDLPYDTPWSSPPSTSAVTRASARAAPPSVDEPDLEYEYAEADSGAYAEEDQDGWDLRDSAAASNFRELEPVALESISLDMPTLEDVGPEPPRRIHGRPPLAAGREQRRPITFAASTRTTNTSASSKRLWEEGVRSGRALWHRLPDCAVPTCLSCDCPSWLVCPELGPPICRLWRKRLMTSAECVSAPFRDLI